MPLPCAVLVPPKNATSRIRTANGQIVHDGPTASNLTRWGTTGSTPLLHSRSLSRSRCRSHVLIWVKQYRCHDVV